MAKNEFDPYHRWLGIPASEQPANHYRLLGLALCEADADVIEAAAIRQTTHVRSHALGLHGDTTQSILNEIAEAKITLLNPEKKKRYDEGLRSAAKTEKDSSLDAFLQSSASALSSSGTQTSGKTDRWQNTKQRRQTYLAASAGWICFVLALMWFGFGKEPNSDTVARPSVQQQELIAQASSVAEEPVPSGTNKGLLCHYSLDGHANDNGKSKLHGRLSNIVSIENRFGTHGKATRFRGDIDSFIELRPPQVRRNAISLCFWLRVDDAYTRRNQVPVFLGIPRSSKGSGLGLSLTTLEGYPAIQAGNFGADGDSLIGKKNIVEERWIHYAFCSGVNCSHLYENGQLVATTQHTSNPAGPVEGSIQLGRSLMDYPTSSRQDYALACALDDLRIYNRILQPGEVMAIFDYESKQDPFRN